MTKPREDRFANSFLRTKFDDSAEKSVYLPEPLCLIGRIKLYWKRPWDAVRPAAGKNPPSRTGRGRWLETADRAL